ncbi:DNA-directed RNA polymerase III subunit RPC10 isoform X1 [Culex pipiens pallens]|uniref:DNA-directed RNA polymerase III subunit RPC10 isoform X1 n=1 Tax=Culex pipiens pallens TaxID=42434 RepID=UPI001952A2C1|nr:DNA-directed RNA polymerase III subunit RPC10 isoform X1 [Culex pipiens pallens]
MKRSKLYTFGAGKTCRFRFVWKCDSCKNKENTSTCQEGTDSLRFSCNTCPYICKIKRKISTRIYPKLKEVDHVMGGSAAWENVDSTDADCPACAHNRAYFMQMQTRSADEPMTTFYKCANPVCGHNWRD